LRLKANNSALENQDYSFERYINSENTEVSQWYATEEWNQSRNVYELLKEQANNLLPVILF